ncbi:hypothetical protein Poli38472_000643 [Pythium oligandrum]|uniref:RNA polymerase-associated protein CTR9-like protein n=1 Tax=Pythium oligandrum TaxID=41045 RepID=A0A8K1FFI8_PYTOL|nr:hypothetical protein Poli38472_000643 [Pythium oligandrum]|eukprot:TMW60601.1 hypothetical protein Poli38472_000643 [Pythium oligandrum]
MAMVDNEELPAPRSLLIPVKNSDQAVEVFTDELPDDVNDIIDILRAEVAPLDVWLQFAVEYYNQGCIAQFQEILGVASEPGIEEIYKDNASRLCRIKFFNALASHAVNAMWHEDDEKKREAISQRAVGYFQRADRLDHQHPMTLVGKALMFMAKNEDDRADRFLKSVLMSNKKNLPAMLAKALLLYRKKKYGEAKKLYLEAIKLHPRSPQASRMRMCFAYCCYRENAIDKARAVMRYAVSLDDTNVDAVIASALWQLASLSRDERAKSIREETSRFMMMIHHAHAIDKTNPTVLNHLANHYFSQWIPLPCTVSVVRGSSVVATSKDISSELSPGQIVCIGDRYVAYISKKPGSVSPSGITLDGPYREQSASMITISRKNYDKMFTLAGSAFHSTKIPEIRSESCYLMGRGCHAEGKYKEAYSYYFNAGRLWPNFVLPWLGLAQMYFERKEYTKAVTYLEKANKAYPENVEVLALLGHAYGKLGKIEEAVVLLRRVVELEPGNVDALIGTAELLHPSEERRDQILAISSYIAAEKVMQHASENVPYELYVNLGALQQRVGKNADAVKSFKRALMQLHSDYDGKLDSKDTDGDEDMLEEPELPKVTSENATILYNMALIYEDLGDHELAKLIYESILEVFPKYIDCLLRLGCMIRDRGDEEEAKKKFEQALLVDPHCADACILQANMYLQRREWSHAQKQFERVMGMPNMKNDPYALLSMGNIFMSNLTEKLRYAKNMALSETYYKKTLQLQPRNIFAANGLGIMMAEKGNFELAKLIFSQVREASPDMPDAWINLAHIFVAEERYSEAIQLYSVCLSKCYNGQDLEVILYLAKAYYESKNFPMCIKTLSRGLHMYPDDMRLSYNLALAQEDYAVATLGQEAAPPGARSSAVGQRTMADVQRAIADLKRAQRIFQTLLKRAESIPVTKKGGLPFDKDKASEHEKFCADTLTKASYHLEFERQREEKRRLENEAQRRMLQEYEDRIAREKEDAQRAEEETRKRRADVLQKQEERLKQLSEGWRVREREEEEKKTSKKKAGGGRKRKKGEEEDGFINDGSDEDADGDVSMSIDDMKNRNKKLKKLADKRQKRAQNDSDDEEGGGDAADLFGSDSSEDEAETAPATSTTTKAPAVDSDDEEKEGGDSRKAEKDELFGSSSDSE